MLHQNLAAGDLRKLKALACNSYETQNPTPLQMERTLEELLILALNNAHAELMRSKVEGGPHHG